MYSPRSSSCLRTRPRGHILSSGQPVWPWMTWRSPDWQGLTKEVGHETRTKITSKIDGVAGLPSKTRSNTEYHEEECERRERACADVAIIFEGIDADCRLLARALSSHQLKASPNLHISSVLAMNSEKNCPVLVMNSAGYVQKMPAVAFSE